MGGQQPVHPVSTQWSERLFGPDKLSGMKTQDEKLRELQTEFKDFGRRIEASISDHAETVAGYEKQIAELRTELGFLKSVCDSMNIRIDDGKKGNWDVYQKASAAPEQNRDEKSQESHPEVRPEACQTKLSSQDDCPENDKYLTITDLKEYIENLRRLGKIKCDSPMFLGALSRFLQALGIVELNDKWKSTVTPTQFGINYGYVIPRTGNLTAITYNVKKITDLWVRSSGGTANLLKVVSEFQELQRKFYGNMVDMA